MMNLRNTMRVALLAVATAALATPVFAQEATPPTPPTAAGQGGAAQQDKMLARLTKYLALTPDQVTQIKAIQADGASDMSAGKGRKGMMKGRQEQMTKIRAVLTDDQKTKFDTMQAQMKARQEEKKSAGDSPTAPPSN